MSSNLASIDRDSDTRTLVRTRRWLRYRRDRLSFLSDIDATLSAERSSGQLTLHYAQGRVAVAEFSERAEIESLSS
ncbi:MAG: hypothetical protein WA804_21960 [Terriglobales bacterium]